MYNSSTVLKIKDLPEIEGIDLERLPQELTRIYALVVSLRRQVSDGTIDYQASEIQESMSLLLHLANNLETIIILIPNHPKKDSIAFVAATANALIYKISKSSPDSSLLSNYTISPYIASAVLFLIGNSQADAAEISLALTSRSDLSAPQRKVVDAIVSIATGRLKPQADSSFLERDAFIESDLNQSAVNFLWRELVLGINIIANKLLGRISGDVSNIHFQNVIRYAVSDANVFGQGTAFYGPYRLAKLLEILEGEIYQRGVITIPVPVGVDSTLWKEFLTKLAESRPYLWENHKAAVTTNFLNPGISAVLTLPTGAGKTTLSELKIASALYARGKVVYLVPTHALEDQVNQNLKDLFTEYQNINFEIDGEYSDIEEMNSFPILVMTPERCLSLVNTSSELFNNVNLVAFDEFHLIHGTDIKKDRRAVDAMYCLLQLFTMLPQADYLLISAMVENGEEIRQWIQQITGRECKLFSSTWKPTRQLHGCIVYDKTKVDQLQGRLNEARRHATTRGVPVAIKNSLVITPECFFSLKNIWETENDEDYFRTQITDTSVKLTTGANWNLTSNRNVIATTLAVHFARLKLKTLVFVDNPRICKSVSESINEQLSDQQNNYGRFVANQSQLINILALELGGIEHSFFHNSNHAAVHHGLLLPIERNLTESYFKQTEGSQVVVATATLAQGINLPAEIVIIAGDDRFDEDTDRRTQVEPHELLNAAGRAGRAGLSSQGAVILIPGELVTIKDSEIARRWWQLKNQVFSKGDQCLIIEDPIRYFLDSIQEQSTQLDLTQSQLLFRFKPQTLSETETKTILNKSFYAWKAEKDNSMDTFGAQVASLIQRRNQIDTSSDNLLWAKEIGHKTGVSPSIISELGLAIDNEDFNEFINLSIVDLVDWFLKWARSSDQIFQGLFTKQNTLVEFKRFADLKLTQDYSAQDIIDKLDGLIDVVKMYIDGAPLTLIHFAITPNHDVLLTKGRQFVLRLIPEISFALGLLTLTVLEKAKQQNIEKRDLPLNIRQLASCVREGFNSSRLLTFKKNRNLRLRVETHEAFNNQG